MHQKSILALAFITTFGAPLAAETLVYKIDPVHSGSRFKIRHFINRVPGTFGTFSGEIHFDKAAPENSKAVATLQVASVDTRNDRRDAHLLNEDFFKADQHPLIEFTSTEWAATGENTFKVKGLLKMVGAEHPVELDVTFLGEVEGRGVIRSGWEGAATIDRTRWGITYGGPAVGNEVQIELNIQAHREASAG